MGGREDRPKGTQAMSDIPPTSFTYNTERDDELAVYSGRELLGYVRAEPGAKFWAISRDRLLVGTFDDIRAAMRACANASAR
jgi:hypothetical protein